jgi:septation ring formation regulator EzrA
MATNPINDPVRQLTAMMAQLVRQNQTLTGHVDRVVTGLGDLSKDMRAGFRAVDAKIDAFRAEIDIRHEALRTEMNDRFRAVGTRFDEVDERLSRLGDGMRELHSDMLRLQNDVINAQQSALEAHLRLDDDEQGGQEPGS